MAEGPYPPGPKVLYLGGTGRTGSTVLTRLLGEIPGWFAGGELAFLWRFGLGADGRCSCGSPLARCPVWGAALERVRAAGMEIDASRMVALRRRCWSVHLPVMALPGMRSRLMDRLEEFPDVVEALYRSVAGVTDSRVVVDSSKEPHYSWILRERTALDVYFLQLVRDPRAVTHSWSRVRRELGLRGDVRMATRGPLRAATYYNVSNLAAEAIWSRRGERFAFLRYEDLVADPVATLEAIGRFVGEPIAESPLVAGAFEASDQHIAWGNPGRFERGVIELRADEAWRSSLPAHRGLIATAATGPVARRYGYPLRHAAERRPVSVTRLRDRQLPGGPR